MRPISVSQLSLNVKFCIYFSLGADQKLIEHLTEVARERIAVAISSFTAITNQLIHGNVKINLLNYILEKRDTFTELLKIGVSNIVLCLNAVLSFL